jgi:hypothetical protein
MLVIKIELWPFGDESLKKEIGRGYITNDGTSTKASIGHYTAQFIDSNTKKIVVGKVRDFLRLKLNCWDLLKEALNTDLYPSKANKDK